MLQADGYLTDGCRLFRVIAPPSPDLGIHTAVLEDCKTLAWRTYNAWQLSWLRLREVARLSSPRARG